MFANVLERLKLPLSCRGVLHQRTHARMCRPHFHSWGSSGRRFKSCQPTVPATSRNGNRRPSRGHFLARWSGRRWRSQGDRRQPRDLDYQRRGRGWFVLTVSRNNGPALHRSRRRCRRNPVADVDRDDRPRDDLTARRGPYHGTIGLVAVDRGGLVGDLETGVLEALTRRVHLQAGHIGYPAARRAVDVARIGWRQMHLAEIGGNRLHRLEPGAGGLATAIQVTAAAAPAQWE